MHIVGPIEDWVPFSLIREDGPMPGSMYVQADGAYGFFDALYRFGDEGCEAYDELCDILLEQIEQDSTPGRRDWFSFDGSEYEFTLHTVSPWEHAMREGRN